MGMPRRPVQPSVNELLETFPGRVYQPQLNESLRLLRSWGYGGSSPNINSLDLHWGVGQTPETIEITIAVRSRRPRPDADALFKLVSLVTRTSPKFPIVFERGQHHLNVDGRDRVFKIYTAANSAVAVARVGEFGLMIQGRRSRFETLSLRAIDAGELRQLWKVRARD